ncbi:L-alanine-DL-glutamate epimerase-like enolase superfamily enzyme [Crossiella equi]|uniref:L-alanine-DL-glutamate epimerase-like enolase superfamily enzyme n=1 Tax=Crossiella equi TaxID=130796 RepID=A0ABS5A5Z2_9PSEU|nr:mandelate racemase/muconate lactonizing enzyme family protein [Crossiella equi]MBP2472013.1 L-alanine-DL-glutamate epimerase-like enolase superfamily enzyme [Crossiella equi]
MAKARRAGSSEKAGSPADGKARRAAGGKGKKARADQAPPPVPGTAAPAEVWRLRAARPEVTATSPTRRARIVHAEAFLAEIAVERVRTDAVQAFRAQETIFVELTDEDGATGLGYSYTIGTGGTSVLALLRDHLLPLLQGQDARRIEAIWHRLFAATRSTTVGALTSLALAAVDTALWDLRGKHTGEPLWRLAGGFRDRVPAYDTEGGWLHLSQDELVAEALVAKEAGWRGIKVKIGKPDAQEDLARLRAVRGAVGPEFALMVDANQSLTVAGAIQRARLFEPVDLGWLEEPLPADDVAGHQRLAAATSIPVAVGESLYSVGQFREYLHRQAAGIVQVDVARIGGITPWLKVAHLAEAYHVQVCPHFLMELHVSLAAAVPNGRYVEHIPQLRAVTTAELAFVDGHALAPDAPGLGIAWDRDALENLRRA